VTINVLSRVPPCFRRHVKPFVVTAFVVSTHRSKLSPRGGLWPVLPVSVHKEGLYPSSGAQALIMNRLIGGYKMTLNVDVSEEYLRYLRGAEGIKRTNHLGYKA
jgi:hypothetical protein